MARRLLYIYGPPGTGKITVARILEARLGWRLFWLHDLDTVCTIVGRYPIPRLMDRISAAVLEELMDDGQDIIYVRPSRDKETVLKVLALAEAHGYYSYPVQLEASEATLVDRVSKREPSKFRVSNRQQLRTYLDGRPASYDEVSSFVVPTDGATPEEVADCIISKIFNMETVNASTDSGRECSPQ